MTITDNVNGIPDEEYFAVQGKEIKQVLEILKEISTNDRNKLFNLRFKDVKTLFTSIRQAEQVKVEHQEAIV